MIFSLQDSKTKQSQLPISLRLLGINHKQEPIHRPKGISIFQWFYCVKGSGELIINQRRSILHKGQGALIYPGVPHSYRGLDDDWTVHFFGFAGSNSMELLKTLHMHESDVYHFSKPNTFPEHIQRLYYLRERDMINKSAELSKECYSFLVDLSFCVKRINTSVFIQENVLVQKIVTYLEENYEKPISLDDLAADVQLSKEYICTCFKQEMQQTIMRYLMTIRISRARVFLLQYPEKRVLEIAKMCGFESPSYFGKIFKREVGVTPENYRNGILT